jgi:hypothetical protein
MPEVVWEAWEYGETYPASSPDAPVQQVSLGLIPLGPDEIDPASVYEVNAHFVVGDVGWRARPCTRTVVCFAVEHVTSRMPTNRLVTWCGRSPPCPLPLCMI